MFPTLQGQGHPGKLAWLGEMHSERYGVHWQAAEEERAALELAQRLDKKLARKQDMSAKHTALDEGLQRVRARIRHQETLLQVSYCLLDHTD